MNSVRIILLIAAAAELGSAQIQLARIVGRLQDSSGAVLVDAKIQVKRTETNEVFQANTTSSGDYTVLNLPPGQYEIRASARGFKIAIRERIVLDIGSTVRQDFTLQISDNRESVTVEAQSPILTTEAPTTGEVVTNRTMDKLPNRNRDFTSLGAMIAGVTPARGGAVGEAKATFNVLGRRRSDNITYIDGTLLSDTNGLIQFTTNLDAMDEYDLKTSLYSAEYGIRPGGQFSVTTKSGTNALHGTLFEFLRNDNLDARNFFDPGARPEYRRNNFGATIGGPIYVPKIFNGKDKAWFFFSYYGNREARLNALKATMPTDAEKSGVFSNSIRDPLTQTPFPNNTIPADRINPIARKLLGYWPSPNTPTGIGYNFVSPNSTTLVTDDEIVAKVDFNTSPNDHWSGRFMWHDVPLTEANVIQTFYRRNPLYNYLQNIANTHIFGAKYVNDMSFHFYRRPFLIGTVISNGSEGFGAALGIPNFPLSSADINGVPVVNVTGVAPIGDRVQVGAAIIGNWEFKDNFSFSRGAHSFRTGYHFRRQYYFLVLDNRTSLSFANQYSGSNFADFLLGYPSNATQGAANARGNLATNDHYFYFTDDWKIRSNLTMTLGVRHEHLGPWKDKRGFMSNFNPVTGQVYPDPLPLTLQPWQTGRFPANYPALEFQNGRVLPRIGLAYRMTANTVIRAGYGAYGNELLGGAIQNLGGNPRPNAVARQFLADRTVPTISLSDPFNQANLTTAAGLPNLQGIESALRQPWIQAWGLSIQHAIRTNTVIEVGYSGNSAIHDTVIVSLNDATPGPGPRQSRRPYPQYQSVLMNEPIGTSSYNGLNVTLRHRPGPEGLSLLAAYSFGKSIDTAGGRLNASGDPNVITRNLPIGANRGRGEADNPGRFSLAAGYELPFGKGRLDLHGLLGYLLAGWHLEGFFTIQAGPYLTPALSFDNLDSGSSASYRPDLIRDPNLPSSERSIGQWFDTNALVQPTAFQYGNAGRNIIQAPGIVNLDASVLRSFPIKESMRLEFRFEAFNATNTTSFGFPGTTLGLPTFGKITTAQEARDLQFGLKLYF